MTCFGLHGGAPWWDESRGTMVWHYKVVFSLMHVDRERERQTDRQVERETDRHTETETERVSSSPPARYAAVLFCQIKQ